MDPHRTGKKAASKENGAVEQKDRKIEREDGRKSLWKRKKERTNLIHALPRFVTPL